MRRRYPTLLTTLGATLACGLGLQPASSQADGIAGTANYTLTTTAAIPAATGPVPGTPSVTVSGTLSSGSATVSLPTNSAVAVGYEVSGTGIPAGTTVSQIGPGGAQVILSQSATATGAESLVFAPNIAPPQVVAAIEPVGGVPTPPTSSTVGPLTNLSGPPGFNTNGVYDYLNTPKDANGNLLQPIAFGLSFYGQGLAAGGVLSFSLNVANTSAPPQLVPQTSGIKITLQPPDSSSSSSTGTGTLSTASETPEPLSVLVWSALAGAGLLRARAFRKSRTVSVS